MKASVGFSSKKYTHLHRVTNNTSSSFGDVQPLLSRKLHGGDSISVNAKQFVRLMPMPYPSLANIQSHTVGRFVDMGQIAPWYDNYLTQTPYLAEPGLGGFIPKYQPLVSNVLLFNCLFAREKYSVVKVLVGSSSTVYSVASDTVVTYLSTHLVGAFGINETVNHLKSGNNDSELTPVSADYVIRVETSDDKIALICYRLNSAGVLLYKILTGLGYRPSVNDTTSLNLMPILGYAKSLWDEFGIQRNMSFSDTKLYSDIMSMSKESSWFDGSVHASLVNSLLQSVFLFLNQYSFVTLGTDWWSSQSATPYLGNGFGQMEVIPTDVTAGTQTPIDVGASPNGGSNPVRSTPNLVIPASKTGITAVSITLLSRLTQMFAKDTLVGHNIEKFIKARYGDEITNQIYASSNRCGDMVTHVSVSDVDSMADTAQSGSSSPTGSYLGSFAGKGQGSAGNRFSFKARTDGYFFLMFWIAPQESYFQFTAPELQYYSLVDEARPEYDALGYELTPMTAAWTDNQIASSETLGAGHTITNSSAFGYAPRYHGWKHINNVVNGDLSLRRYRAEMRCFYLDRYVDARELYANGDNKFDYAFKSIPTASDAWRYLGKYPWMQSFNRIFYNSPESNPLSGYNPDGSEYVAGKHYPDNFIIHNVFDVQERTSLKPFALSYNSFVEDVDNANMEVSQS